MGKLSQHLTLDEDPKMSSKDYEPQQVILNLATSHSCSVKEHIWNTDYRPVTATEPTHDWEFKIEDPNRQDMRHYIDKIVINLHNTFPNPVRTFREPPFVVKESGYGNFEILVEIYFKGLSDKDAIRKISFNHNLFLTPTIQDVRNKKAGIKRENTFTMPRQFTLTHKDPSFIKRLLKGGGKKVSPDKSSLSSSSMTSVTSKSGSSSKKSSSSSSSKNSSSSSSHHRGDRESGKSSSSKSSSSSKEKEKAEKERLKKEQKEKEKAERKEKERQEKERQKEKERAERAERERQE